MNILLVNKFFFIKGGAERVFFQERDFLLSHGHHVIDFSMAHPENFPSSYSRFFVPHVDYASGSMDSSPSALINQLRIAIDFVYNRKAVSRLTTLIAIEKPQIAHLHNIYHQITPAIIPVVKNAGAKVVLTVHDYKLVCPSYLMFNRTKICSKCQGGRFWHATAKRCYDGSRAKSLLLTIEAYWHRWRKSYEDVDLFVCPSRFMSTLLIQSGFKAEKIRIIHNGMIIPEGSSLMEQGGYVLYFGRIARGKGIETLLAAHALLPRGVSLKIVGTGPSLPELEKKYPDAEFMGYKKNEVLQEIIRRALCVVIPSECYENFSMAILEAMALGKPIIASRIGGIPEQIEEGRTGLLFRPGDVNDLAAKMKLLIEDRMLRLELGQAAKAKLAKEYSLDRHCRNLMGAFEDLLAKG